MIRTSRGMSKVLSEKDCNIQDHLRNHAHLTNCIHLKNQIHVQKPKVMLDKQHSVETSLMKDLIVLQRSRSLRDPSTSPSWNSPIIGSFMKRLEKEGAVTKNDLGGVKSLAGEPRKDLRRALTASPLSQRGTSRKTGGRVGGAGVEDSTEKDRRHGRSSKGIGYSHADNRLRFRDLKRNARRKGVTDENRRSDSEIARVAIVKDSSGTEKPLMHGCSVNGRTEANKFGDDLIGKNMLSGMRKISRRGVDNKHIVPKRLTGRLKNYSVKGPAFQHPHLHQNGSWVGKEVINDEEAETHSAVDGRKQSTLFFDSHFHSHLSAGELSGPRTHKSKGIRRPHFHMLREFEEHREVPSLSSASNSLGRGVISTNDLPDSQRFTQQTVYGETEVIDFPKKGCGIPWNWSRIHDRGKSILDLAGRSLSCGLSDSATRKIEGLASQSHSSSCRDFAAPSGSSDHCNSSLDSDSESLPLLVEPGGSQESADTDAQGGKLSGELDLYADNKINLRQNTDLSSETRSTDHFGRKQDLKGSGRLRHDDRNRSLTQKYVPKTFRELVGQNLVAQALMNAILRGKIAPVYVFHGPHGTGKTSCARIFAAAMNCHSLEQSRPCGLCSSCIAQSLGKCSGVREIGGVGSLGFDSFQSILDNVILSLPSCRFRVFIVDDCDTLTSDDWNAFLKILAEIPWHVVFILITSNLDRLPHTIVTRCQKFLFPKLKEVDIADKLRDIALQEDLEIDNDALTLIASRSNGSMRDAEMTLDQLSLLGQRISLPLVQELVGLIPDEKLVDLLDLALSADAINTVKSLRELMEAGVEPLALMSQLATLITDILAGSYKLHKERRKRMFFHKPTLSKEEMNRLRQALRTLSEAEKQLLLSNDRTTWLTAAMLQLAPDQSYAFPSSSAGTSVAQSPVVLNDPSGKGKEDRGAMCTKRSNLDKHSDLAQHSTSSPMREAGALASAIRDGILPVTAKGPDSAIPIGCQTKSQSLTLSGGKKKLQSFDYNVESRFSADKDLPVLSSTYSDVGGRAGQRQAVGTSSNTTAQLEVQSQELKTRAEHLNSSVSQAFQLALDCPVAVQINGLPTNGEKDGLQLGAVLPADKSITSNTIVPKLASDCNEIRLQPVETGSDIQTNVLCGLRYGARPDEHGAFQSHVGASSSEIVESESMYISGQNVEPGTHLDEERLESAWVQEAQSSPHVCMFGPHHPEKDRNTSQQLRSESLVKSKGIHDHSIQKSQGNIDGLNQDLQDDCAGGSSKQKGRGHQEADRLFSISQEGFGIAEKIEEENLRLESRSGGLLCWKAPEVTTRKGTHFKRKRRSRFFLTLVPCAKSSR